MFGSNNLFDYNWDVNKYKTNYDPEYWDICRTFMEVHKTKYPEQRLLHLTEAFYQIGVYGSSYDAKTTRMVSALAVEVLEEFLKKHPGALRHPFKNSAVLCSEVIDITEDIKSKTEDVSKSLTNQCSSIWDVPVDTNIIVNVMKSCDLIALFKGFIVIYDVKQNSMMNDDKVSILGESFKRSKFGSLHWDKNNLQNIVCPIQLSLKWKGTVLAEARGGDEDALRIRVAQAVLSKLANLFYGIESKWMYYRDGQIPEMFHHPDSRRSDVYRVLPHSQLRDKVQIISFIDTFANSDSFAELVFGMDFSTHEKAHIIEYVTKSWSKKLAYRSLSKMGVKSKTQTHVCVYQIRTGEELKHWISKSGGENERYRLVPPKGHRRAGSCDNNIREILRITLEESRRNYNEGKKIREEGKIKKEEEDKKKREEEEKKRKDEEKKRKEEEEKKRRNYDEGKKIREEEKKKREEEEKKRKVEEEKKRKDEDEKKKKMELKKKEEEEKRQLEEKKKKKLETENKGIVYPYEDNQKYDEIIEDNFEKLLDGFVLFYDAKKNSEINKDDWLSALLESFKISKFGPLEVLSENLRPMRTRCVLKWNNKILASAEGLTETQAKTAATLQLISKLEPFTYIIQAKEEYFFGGKVPPFVENPDPSKSHIYRVVRRQDLPSYYSIFQIIDEFVKVPSYCEIIFGQDFTWELKNEIVVYIKAKHLDYRYFTVGDQKPWTHMAVYHTVNPEALKNHLYNNGGENAKYKLILPPNSEPIPNKTAEVEDITVSGKSVANPLEKVVEKRKQPEKDTSTEELEGNKIQIKLKKFKMDKVEYPEDTGGDFPGLILWIGIKKNSTWQRSLFCILLESFKMSKYGELLVEEDEEKVWGRKEPFKKCVIKSNRKVLGVGLGESKTEAKNSAALQALRLLRKNCYTIQAKESYFKEGKATPYNFEPENGKDNVYRLAKRGKFKDRASIIKFVDNFNMTSCNHEVIFGDDFSYDEREAILLHCRQINLPYRLMKCQSTGRMIHTHIAIYHQKPLPTVKAALMAVGGEDDKFRLIHPGGKISTQNSETDMWPDTLENASHEASVDPISLDDGIKLENDDLNLAPLPSGAEASSSQQVLVSNKQANTLIPVIHADSQQPKKNKSQLEETSNFASSNLHTPNMQNQSLNAFSSNPNEARIPELPSQSQFITPVNVYGQQPHPDMPLSFGTQLRPANFVPSQVNEVQSTAADMSVHQERGNVVIQQPDLRDELSRKRQEESFHKKTSERYDMSRGKKVIKKEYEDDKGWSRNVFVTELKSSEKTGERIASKTPDLRENLMRKDFSRHEPHRHSNERNYEGTSQDHQNPNSQRITKQRRSPWRYHQNKSPDRNSTRYTEKERFRSPFGEEEIRVVRENESTTGNERTYHPSRSPERWRSLSPVKYIDDRRQYRSQSPGTRRSRDLWKELAENYSRDIFMYKYVKQDSKTESDPIALLRATRCYKFNIDFDFVTRKVSFNEWRASVELVSDEDGSVNLLVGEAVATSIDEAKLMAAQHAVETVQKACRVIKPNKYYFAEGGVPEFIEQKCPMKTHIYEIIQNMDPEFPLDRFTVETMVKMFISSKLEDLFFLATDFSYEERMIAIEIADKMDLCWRLFGPRHPHSLPEDIVSTQHVCVHKQKSALHLFEELLKNRGSTEKYSLVANSHIDPLVDPFECHIDPIPSSSTAAPFGKQNIRKGPVPTVPFGKKRNNGPAPNPVPTVPFGKKRKNGPAPNLVPIVPFGKKRNNGPVQNPVPTVPLGQRVSLSWRSALQPDSMVGGRY